MNIDIRPVRSDEEIARVAVIAKNTWESYYPDIIGIEQTEYMISLFQSRPAITHQIQSEGYLYFLLIAQNEDVGYFSIIEEGLSLFLSKIYVKAKHQRKGISSLVFNFLEEWCKTNHLSRIYLTVNRNNENAIRAYEKNGYNIIRSQVSDIGNGYVMDDYVMEKCF